MMIIWSQIGVGSRCALLAAGLALLPGPAGLEAQDVDFGEIGEQRVDLPEDGTTENFWVLDFRTVGLRMISPRSGPGAGKIYWYLVYTVENPSNQDREIFVTITAESDHGRKYADLFLPFVERAVEQKEGKRLWGRTDEFEVLADRDPTDPRYRYLTLKSGEKRRSVAVFNRLDPNANHVKIRIKGLSNEIRTVAGDGGGNALEERVLVLTFNRPGDEFAVTNDTFRLVSSEWSKARVEIATAGNGR